MKQQFNITYTTNKLKFQFLIKETFLEVLWSLYKAFTCCCPHIDCRLNSGGEWWIHVSFIVTYLPKNLFCCVETVATKVLNRQHILVFDRLCANAEPTPKKAFSLTNVHAKLLIHCLLISSTLLSHATSIQDLLKGICGDFSCFPR